jgi:hypothetical protein
MNILAILIGVIIGLVLGYVWLAWYLGRRAERDGW